MAKTKAEKKSGRAANFGFAALLFALVGWANLEVLLVMSSAGMRGHLLTIALGAFLSTVAYRRCQFWRAPARPSAPAFGPRGPSRASDLGSGFALAAAGCMLAYSMRIGFVTTTVIGAAFFTFIPWSSSRFCRKHFLVSLGLLVAGGLPILMIAATNQHRLILLAHTWVLWTLAAGLTLSALLSERSAVPPPHQALAEPHS